MSFFTLLENSGLGRWDSLMEAMTPMQARQVFDYLGATDIDTPDKLKSAFRRLAMKLHPDRNPGDAEAERQFKELSAAYDVLTPSTRPEEGSADAEDGEYPVWASAGHSGGQRASARIYKKNYTDMNFFKKRMWELSDHSREQWTIWQFDGRFFRHTITVFGSPEIFHEMAEAMLIWGSSGNPYNTRAIFVQRRGDPMLYLIYSDGEFHQHPVPFEHDSFNLNPSNDQQFVNRLPAMLDEIKDRQSLLT